MVEDTDQVPIGPKPIPTPPSPAKKSNRIAKASIVKPSGKKPAASVTKGNTGILRYFQRVPGVPDSSDDVLKVEEDEEELKLELELRQQKVDWAIQQAMITTCMQLPKFTQWHYMNLRKPPAVGGLQLMWC